MNDIEIRTNGAIGHATLNRPQALNALTHQMLLDLETAMQDWASNEDIAALLIDAAGDRAFCAGGDIVDLYAEGIQGQDTMAKKFWRDEYRINAAIAGYAKPYIAVMDGIVMGGGAGVSTLGSHRIVTDRTMFAMPECSIGLIPDVGGSYFLGQCPGFCGEYIGLTGTRLTGADCIYARLADYYVPHQDLPALKQALFQSGDPATIQDFAQTPEPSALATNSAEIETLFGAESVQDIHEALKSSGTKFAQAAQKGLERGAPLALMATLKAIRAGRKEANLAQALRNEYRFVSTVIKDGEFIEGVRAAVIDKDRNPIWKYPTYEDVPNSIIQKMDHPADDGDFIV